MKKTLLIFLFSSIVNISAQVTNQGEPASWKLQNKTAISAIEIPIFDIKKIKQEDETQDKIQTKPFRTGIEKKINYGLKNAGQWTTLPNGDRIWRVLFHSKDALHLSVNFDSFYLPKGATIYLYNSDKTDLLGAYTETQNNPKEKLGTWFVKGDLLWIEYYEPKEVKGQGKLHLSSIIHDYRQGNTYQKGYSDLKLNQSGDCNLDVDCPIGADFESNRDVLKKSVAFLRLGNGYVCSGTLINNTAQDKKPYFLSANHCSKNEDGSDADPSLFSMRFNWISPNPICASTDNSTDATANLSISGAEFKSRNANSDVMLVEITSAIPNDWDVTFAGWDKTDVAPAYVVGIHHPSGDIMKICRDNTGVIKGPNNAGGSTAQTWEITTAGGGWELGVTEGGSSGSALFNPDGEIIGQLYGGGASCTGTSDNGQLDFYGRFAISWNAGSSMDTRLKEWLDPQGENPDTLNVLQNSLAIDDVDDDILSNNIAIFPNPTSGELYIQTNKWGEKLNYQIYDLLGQELLSNTLKDSGTIKLDALESNVYFLKIIEKETNKSVVKKIILRK